MTFPLQKTIRYKTYIKTAMQEAIQSVFANHPDPLLAQTKVRLDFSFEEVDFPAIVIRYYGKDFQNSGIGHKEIRVDPVTGRKYKAQRRLYHGDIEFAIYALSSLDRDIISDALTQVLGMSELAAYTNFFLLRLYDPDVWAANNNVSPAELTTAHLYHFVNVNTDLISEFGESQVPAPWMPEDVLLYQTTHRIPTMGEVLSLPPEVTYNIISKVVAYPYVAGLEPVPPGQLDPSLWMLDPGV